jgi:hypothetical protein
MILVISEVAVFSVSKETKLISAFIGISFKS